LLHDLHSFPTRRSSDLFVAVDPDLIVHRSTLGLFFDLFDKGGTSFSERFGYVFDKFVGQLLSSACPQERLWSSSEWEQSLSCGQDRKSTRLNSSHVAIS